MQKKNFVRFAAFCKKGDDHDSICGTIALALLRIWNGIGKSIFLQRRWLDTNMDGGRMGVGSLYLAAMPMGIFGELWYLCPVGCWGNSGYWIDSNSMVK